MAKRGNVGEVICGHCGSTKMTPIRTEKKSEGTVERTYYRCGNCGEEDYLD